MSGEIREEIVVEEEYVQAFTPDKMKLAMYVNRAKGVERTMAQFAEQCGVSASTLSRIVNGKITNPVAEELLRRIAENSSNEDISLSMLMRANGMIPKDMREQRSAFSNWERREAQMNAENIVKNTVAEELFARGHMIQFFQRLPIRDLPNSEFGLGIYSSFAVHVQGIEPKYWNFILNPTVVDEDDERSIREFERFERMTMDRYSSIFLRDIWEPETFNDVKMSFVFVDPFAFARFEALVLKTKVNSEMSVILMDIDEQKVIKEVMIPRHSGQTGPSIFAEEIIAQEKFEDDFWDDDKL